MKLAKLLPTILVALLGGCSLHQGQVRFPQTGVPVVFGSRDAMGEAPGSSDIHRTVGTLAQAVGEGSGVSRIGNYERNWEWSLSTRLLDEAAGSLTSRLRAGAIHNLTIQAETKATFAAEVVIMTVRGDAVDVVAPATALSPPPLPLAPPAAPTAAP